MVDVNNNSTYFPFNLHVQDPVQQHSEFSRPGRESGVCVPCRVITWRRLKTKQTSVLVLILLADRGLLSLIILALSPRASLPVGHVNI